MWCINALMKRFSISVAFPQYERLVKRSRQLGISIGELIRRIIDGWNGL